MNRCSRNLLALFILLLMASVQLACQDGVGEGDLPGPPDQVRVVFDPAAGVVPQPTDLVRDEEAQRLAIPTDEEATAAQAEFNEYLNGLDGYPLSTAIRIPVSGAVDESSLGRGIYLLEWPSSQRLGTDSYFDEATSEIVVEPRQPLAAGARCVVGVRGYEGGARGMDGEPLVADAAFFLVRSTEDLRDHPDAMPGQTGEERQAQAEELAQLQEQLATPMELLLDAGLPREEMAVAFEFTMTSEPAIAFDSATGEVPLPNDVLVDEATGKVSLPIDEATMTGEEVELRQALSQMEGFSMSAAIRARSTHQLGDDDDDEGLFRLFERGDDGSWSERSDLERGRLDEGHTLWLRPELTLEPEREYVFTIDQGLRSDLDKPHRAQPLGAILRLASPLVDESGQSTLRQLSDEQAQKLEPLRRRVDDLLRELEASEDLERRDLAAAVPFRTAPAAAPLLARRAKLYEQEVSTAVTDIETTVPNDIFWQLLTDVESVVRGKMTILDHLDPATRAFYEDGHAEERQVDFVMTLPEDVPVEEPLPVVLFGHGLMTSRELLYLIAGELASAGYAAFALDLPYHGERSVCLEDDDCADGATCDELGQCRQGDGSKGALKDVQLGYLAPFLESTPYNDLLHYPMTSGEVFIDMASLVGTRDHFAQALLDLNQAVRVIRSEELSQAVVDATGLWVGEEIMYLGMSLGGILGSSLSAVEPTIDDFVLNVPAADLIRLIENSVTFDSMFSHALDSRDIERGSDEYFTFINGTRWLLDPVDPLNLVQHTQRDLIDYDEPGQDGATGPRQARVLIQMADGDKVVPNVGTQALSQRMDVEIETYEPLITDHGFLFDPNPLAVATQQARQDLVDFFEGP